MARLHDDSYRERCYQESEYREHYLLDSSHLITIYRATMEVGEG